MPPSTTADYPRQHKASILKALDRTIARSILGHDLITGEEINRSRTGISYTDEMLGTLAATQPSVSVLNQCKVEGYVVMPAPPTPMCLPQVRFLKPSLFSLRRGGLVANPKFAGEDKTLVGWFALKKTPVAGSMEKTWREQIKLLSADQMVPNAALFCWSIAMYFEIRGVRLFEEDYVRTSSLETAGHHVIAGCFDKNGMDTFSNLDITPDVYVGLAACLKL